MQGRKEDVGMKFMHISDVHLGVKPDVGKPWSQRRARDIWDSFAEVIEVAKKEAPEFLFVTGDLFHAQPLKKEIKEVNALFSEIPNTKVIIIAGNHDYLRQKSYYLSFPWAENVFLFKKEEIEAIDFPEENVTVYGLSYWHKEIRECLYDTAIPKKRNRLNILLVHGGDKRHIPFSAKNLAAAGFDYVACGHIHKGEQMEKGRVVMAGALEPTDCNDLGPHGYWMGELTKEGSQLSFFPIQKCQYRHEVFQMNRNTTNRDIINWEQKLLRESEPFHKFRIFLEGAADPDMEPDIARLSESEQVVDVQCNLKPDYDYEKLSCEQEHTLLGRYVDVMLEQEDTAVTRKALEYGVNALLGHKICR